jgi:hypothetical protein
MDACCICIDGVGRGSARVQTLGWEEDRLTRAGRFLNGVFRQNRACSTCTRTRVLGYKYCTVIRGTCKDDIMQGGDRHTHHTQTHAQGTVQASSTSTTGVRALASTQYSYKY